MSRDASTESVFKQLTVKKHKIWTIHRPIKLTCHKWTVFHRILQTDFVMYY